MFPHNKPDKLASYFVFVFFILLFLAISLSFWEAKIDEITYTQFVSEGFKTLYTEFIYFCSRLN